MLHTIFLIFKWIGIVLLALLVLLLVLLCLFLFCPLRYQVYMVGEDSFDSLEGKGSFHWLFRLVSGKAYRKEGVLRWRLRIGWKKLSGGSPSPSFVERNEEPGSGSSDPIRETEAGSRDSVDEPGNPALGRELDPLSEDEVIIEEPESAFSGQSSFENREEDIPRTEQNEKKSSQNRGWKYTFQKIYDKINTIKQKKDQAILFVQDDIHRDAFFRVVKEGKKLAHYLKPAVFSGKVMFGFEDPSLTGTVLAGLSILYPVYGENVELTPDFENKCLKGNLSIRGRLRLIQILIPTAKLFFNKNVKTTYYHLKQWNKS